jgi:hypothetical protein
MDGRDEDEHDTVVLLRRRLTAAAAVVVAPPALAAQVRVGARRRRRRRRARAALAVATCTALGAGAAPGVVQWWDHPRAAQQAAPPVPWYERATRGDLAADAAYLQQAVRAWQDGRTGAPPAQPGAGPVPLPAADEGAPHVVWAGTTPAGPAAVLVQSTGTGGLQTAYVGVDAAGAPVLVGSDDLGGGQDVPPAWFVDPQRRVLAALDVGQALGAAHRWSFAADGTHELLVDPLRPAGGVATLTLPADVDPAAVVVTRLPYRSPADLLPVAGTPAAVQQPPAQRGLPWGTPEAPSLLLVEGPDLLPVVDAGTQDLQRDLVDAVAARAQGVPVQHRSGAWVAAADLVDGSRLLVGEVLLGAAGPARAYAALQGPDGRWTVSDGGPVDPTSPVPVQVELPDGLGRVVVGPRTHLEYLDAQGDWTYAGQSAALVPPDAMTLRVIDEGGVARDVPL